MSDTTFAPHIPPAADHALICDVTWGFYDAMLREMGDRRVSVTYDRGRIELMSPLPVHEKSKALIRRMIEMISTERRIRISSYASTTFRRQDLDRGLEPDECYYVRNAATVDKRDIDLNVDPPPDLVLEVDVTHRSIARLPIYAALGVPEVWRYDGLNLVALSLGTDGEYRPTEMSLSFPFLRVEELNRFVRMWPQRAEFDVLDAFSQWLRDLPPATS
jgi:Uma2 family endonuclease